MNRPSYLGLMVAFLLVSSLFLPGMPAASSDGKEESKSKDEKEKKRESAVISEQEASRIAVKVLEARFGKANYTIVKSRLDDDEYRFELTDGRNRFRVDVDARSGQVKEIESESGRRVESQVEETRKGKRKEARSQPTITLEEAIRLARQFLTQQFGQRNYTVSDIELEDGEYELELRDEAGGRYELAIDASTGRILEFEGKTPELKVEIAKDDKDRLRVEVKERKRDDEKKGFKVGVEKNEPRFKLEFEVRENVTKSELELELLFDRLIEFRDIGAVAGILDTNDTVVATIELPRLQWRVARSEQTSVNGTVTAITIAQTGTGARLRNITFVYHLTPTSRTIAVGNATLTSVKLWQVKFDIHISGFNWTRSDTALALTGRFNTEFEVEVKGQQEVKFKTTDGITPFFSWGGIAVADGARIDVKADAAKNRITLSYPHFTRSLTHDPRIGYVIPVALPPLEVLVPTLLVAVGALLATLLAGGVSLRSRRRRSELLRLPVSLGLGRGSSSPLRYLK